MASTGICSRQETIPDPGVLNRQLLRKAWTLLTGSSTEMLGVSLLLAPFWACRLGCAHKMALLVIAHSSLVIAHSSGAFPSPGLCSLPGEPTQSPGPPSGAASPPLGSSAASQGLFHSRAAQDETHSSPLNLPTS